jgi:dolichol-phosphate mannosyltransferase
MVALWHEQGLEIVEAVKTARGEESFLNKVGARVFYRGLSYLSGYNLDGASDFKLIDRKVVEAWNQLQERTTFFRGIIAWLGYSRGQLFFQVRPRKASRSRWNLWSLCRLALLAVTAFSSLPLQVVTILGGFVLAFSIAFGVYTLIYYFSGHAVPGFTTVILLQLIIAGVLMMSLGIIGTYLARIYEETKRRPRYLISAAFSHETGSSPVTEPSPSSQERERDH